MAEHRADSVAGSGWWSWVLLGVSVIALVAVVVAWVLLGVGAMGERKAAEAEAAAVAKANRETVRTEMKSDAAEAALAIESYFVENPDYEGPLTADVAAEGGFENVNGSEVVIDGTHADGYRVCVWHPQSGLEPKTMGYEFDFDTAAVQNAPVDCARGARVTSD